MRGKLLFAAGMGVGYLLGARAGRERFDQILARGRNFWDSPTVQEAAGVVQAQAGRLYGEGKKAATDQLHRVGSRNGQGRGHGHDHQNGRLARVGADPGRGHFPPERAPFGGPAAGNPSAGPFGSGNPGAGSPGAGNSGAGNPGAGSPGGSNPGRPFPPERPAMPPTAM